MKLHHFMLVMFMEGDREFNRIPITLPDMSRDQALSVARVRFNQEVERYLKEHAEAVPENLWVNGVLFGDRLVPCPRCRCGELVRETRGEDEPPVEPGIILELNHREKKKGPRQIPRRDDFGRFIPSFHP